jgi:hypothetical protein
LQLFIYSSQGGVVVHDSAPAPSSCHLYPLEGGANYAGHFSNRTDETCLLEDSASYEEEDIGISESSYKVGTPSSRVPDQLGWDMGESQTLDSEHTPAILDRIAKARVYMEKVAIDDKYGTVRGICKNSHNLCALWAIQGECESNSGYMMVNCAPVCESCEQWHLETAILDRIEKARVYMEMVAVDDKYEKVRGICKNSHTACAFWAVLGECEGNAGYMTVNCAPVCESCEQLHVETRCPMDPDAIDVLYPGDLDTMFQGIITNPDFQQYEPKVLSRPEFALGDSAETADYQLGPW